MRALLLALVLAALSATTAHAATDVLVFSKTAGFRHDAIPDAVRAVGALGFGVTATEDAAVFTDERLRRFDAVVFLLTTGDVLDAAQQAALRRFVRAGGGWVGVHSAADTEYDWPFYGALLSGAWFASHPAPRRERLVIFDRRHPATRVLGDRRRWTRFDEWYRFRTSPRLAGARVLLGLARQADLPLAWASRAGRGRTFYTALGHTRESWRERLFLRHVRGGILSVVR